MSTKHINPPVEQISWMKAILIVLIGFAQCVTGAAIAVFSLGNDANFGLGVMYEGFEDIILIFEYVFIDEELNVYLWFVQKIVGYSINVLFTGLQGVKNSINTIHIIFQEITSENSTLTENTKEGLTLLSKKIGLEFVKCLTKKIIVELSATGIENILLPSFQIRISKLSGKIFNEALRNKTIIEKMLMDDIINNSETNSCLIKSVVNDIILKENFVSSTTVNVLDMIIKSSAKSFSLSDSPNIETLVLKDVEIHMSSIIRKMNIVFDKMVSQNEYNINSTLFQENLDKLCDKYKVLIWNLSDRISNHLFCGIKKTFSYPIQTLVNYGVSNIDFGIDGDIEKFKLRRRIYCDDYTTEYQQENWKDNFAESIATEIISDLSSDGEIGLPHLGTISDVIKKPITILDENGHTMFNVGKKNMTEAIKVEYHKPTKENGNGHWTLPNAKEPIHNQFRDNNCFFDVIASQTKMNAEDIWKDTLKQMIDNKNALEKHIYDIKKLENLDKILLLYGGAKYTGKSAYDAARVIDASQGVAGYQYSALGHSRGHASYPQASGDIDSVENYSRSGEKSGFLSRDDQNKFGHIALSSNDVQNALSKLNTGSNREVIHLPVTELHCDPPMMSRWSRGEQIEPPRNARTITLVLQHHQHEKNNPDADVHVHTMYPRTY